jgi:hypothetical protein
MKTLFELISEKRSISHDRFLDVLEDVIPMFRNVKTAYEYIETEYERQHGERRYSSYQSYKNQRYTKLKTKKRR